MDGKEQLFNMAGQLTLAIEHNLAEAEQAGDEVRAFYERSRLEAMHQWRDGVKSSDPELRWLQGTLYTLLITDGGNEQKWNFYQPEGSESIADWPRAVQAAYIAAMDRMDFKQPDTIPNEILKQNPTLLILEVEPGAPLTRLDTTSGEICQPV